MMKRRTLLCSVSWACFFRLKQNTKPTIEEARWKIDGRSVANTADGDDDVLDKWQDSSLVSIRQAVQPWRAVAHAWDA